jgi:hypothetical protein
MENNNKCILVKKSTLDELKKPIQDIDAIKYKMQKQIDFLTRQNEQLAKELEYAKANPVIKEIINPAKISISIYKTWEGRHSSYSIRDSIVIGENIDLESKLHWQIKRIANTFFKNFDEYYKKISKEHQLNNVRYAIRKLDNKSIFKRWIFFRKWHKCTWQEEDKLIKNL